MTELETTFKKVEGGWEACLMKDLTTGDTMVLSKDHHIEFPPIEAWKVTSEPYEAENKNGIVTWTIQCEEVDTQKKLEI